MSEVKEVTEQGTEVTEHSEDVTDHATEVTDSDTEVADDESVEALEAEHSRIHKLISLSKKNVDAIFKPVENMQEQMARDIESMTEAIPYLEFIEQISRANLENMKTSRKELAVKRAQKLNEQQELIDAKVIQLAALEDECNTLETTLKEAKSRVSGLHQNLSAEVDRNVKLTTELRELNMASKAHDEQRRAQLAKMRELDEMERKEQLELDALRQTIAETTEQTTALRIQTAQRNEQIVAQEAQLAELNERIADAKRQNVRLVAKKAATREQRMAEIARLERKNAVKKAENLVEEKLLEQMIAKVNSEFGSVDKLKQMLSDATAKNQQLDDKISSVNKKIVEATKSMAASDVKLSKLDAAKGKILQKLEKRKPVLQGPSIRNISYHQPSGSGFNPPSSTGVVSPPSSTLREFNPPSSTLSGFKPPSSTGVFKPPSTLSGKKVEKRKTVLQGPSIRNISIQPSGSGFNPPSSTGVFSPPSSTLRGFNPPSSTLSGFKPPSSTGVFHPPSSTLTGFNPPSSTLSGFSPPSSTLSGFSPPSSTLSGFSLPSISGLSESVSMERQEEEHIFAIPRDYQRRAMRRHPQQRHQEPQVEPAAASSESSVSDSLSSHSRMDAEIVENRANDHYDRIKAFRESNM